MDLEDIDLELGVRLANAITASVYGPSGERRMKWGEAEVNSTRPVDATSSNEDCIHAQYKRSLPQ